MVDHNLYSHINLFETITTKYIVDAVIFYQAIIAFEN